jgi:very-short-patch-repair endonuclease
MDQTASERARQLRSNQTPDEYKLWGYLRAKRLDGAKFRRQHPIGSYFGDFCCVRSRLIVEIDGVQHEDAERYDRRRSSFLAARGFRVIRFRNEQVIGDMEEVLNQIRKFLKDPLLSSP